MALTTLMAAMAVFAALAPSASAGVATYTGTGPILVSDGNGPAGDIGTATVPAGRTPVQSIEVINFTVFWPASGQELSTQLIGPDGTLTRLFDVGCFEYDSSEIWNFSDSAAQLTPNAQFDPKCDLPGGTFRPLDPLSAFSGKQAPGIWTLRAIDNGVTFINQGNIQTWAVRIVHAPPTFTANAPGSGKLGSLAITANSNATGSVSIGGDAKSETIPMTANAPKQINYEPTAPILQKLKKKGKANVNVSLAFTDDTGGTANANVTFTAKAKKRKKRKKRKGKPSTTAG